MDNKNNKRFTKGDTAFYASTNFTSGVKAADGTTHELFVIISRTVDSAGKVRTTFEDHGNDWVYGRSIHTDAAMYFTSAEDAENYLIKLKEEHEAWVAMRNAGDSPVGEYAVTISSEVYSDADDITAIGDAFTQSVK
tara:strand:- start:226 stop:636 length:411 start_codon:yes stop_codon:yes gene_type:complete